MRLAVDLLRRASHTPLRVVPSVPRYTRPFLRAMSSTVDSAAQPNPQPVQSTSQSHSATEAAQVAVAKQPKPQGVAKPKKEKKGPEGGSVTELDPAPEFFAHRNAIFDKYKKEYQEQIAKLPRQEIEVTLPDGKVVKGTSWETTPFQIAEGIAKSLAERVIISKVSLGFNIRRGEESQAGKGVSARIAWDR